VALDDDDDYDDESSEGEDLLGDVVLRPNQSTKTNSESIDAPPVDPEPEATTQSAFAAATPEPTQPTPIQTSSPESTHTSQELRSRNSTSSPAPSYSTSRAALFASRRKAQPSSPQTSTATAEAILDRQRAEQEALTGSMLDIAQRLKASTKNISSSLETDKEAVGRAGEGLDRTEKRMESATGRMGVLRKMTEGEGWWGRMMLWIRIGIMFLLVLIIMFVMPKLRF
jgi:hypothetical protein